MENHHGIREEPDLQGKCQVLADFFLPVFEDYWEKGGSKHQRDLVELCLWNNNLAFQLAFAVEYGLVSLDGLSQTAIEDIENTYRLLLGRLEAK